HDAQVRRISWVRGVGRPAPAHSGLLVPLPDAGRPPIGGFDLARNRALQLRGARKRKRKRKTPPNGRRFLLCRFGRSRGQYYLIFASLKSTCFLAIGSYLRFVILSVMVRLFFVVT